LKFYNKLTKLSGLQPPYGGLKTEVSRTSFAPITSFNRKI